MDRPMDDDGQPAAEPKVIHGDDTPVTDAAAPTARSGRRIALIAGVAALAVLVLGGGAFAAIRLLGLSNVDPADRLPDSVAVYAEVNLDPSLDQTPKLFDLVDKFGGFDELDFDVESFEELIHRALQEVDADFLEPSELTSWVGTRAAVAGGATQDDELYGVFALASRDDEAAESAMVKIVDELEQELDQEAGAEAGYVVDDGLAIVVVSESDAQSLADELLADGREAPLSGSDKFGTAMDMFDGDQTMLFWYDMDRYYEAMDAMFARFEDEFAMQDVAPLDLEAFNTTDATWLAVGAAATDDGIDIWYHSDGEIMDSEAATDWRDQLGDLPMSQAAGVINLPDNIDDLVSAQLDLMESQIEELSGLPPGATLPNLEYYTPRGQWDYDLALTDEEFAEWEGLYAQWDAGELSEGDAEFDRLIELDDRLLASGTRAEYDAWVDAGGESAERWMYEGALTHAEYLEMDQYDTLARRDELPAADEQRYFELWSRMYSYGVVSDYEFHDGSGLQEMADVRATIEEIVELVSGAGVEFVLEDAFADEPAAGVSVTLEEGPAERILDLPETGEFLREAADELGDGLVFDGPTITFGELAGDGALAEHPDFGAAFDGAPEDTMMAVFVDVTALNTAAPEPEEWLEPVRAVSWANGSQSGLLRILID